MAENEEQICLKPIQYMVRNRQKQISFYHLKAIASKPKTYNRQLTKTNKTLNWFSICNKVQTEEQQQYIDKQEKYQSNSEILAKFLAKDNRGNRSNVGEGCSFMVNTYMSTPKQSQNLAIQTTKYASRCRTQKQRMTPKTNFCKIVIDQHLKRYTECQQKEEQESSAGEQKKSRKKTFIKLCKPKEQQTRQASNKDEKIIRVSSVKLKRARKCKTQF